MSELASGLKDIGGRNVSDGDFVRATYECPICEHKLVGVVDYSVGQAAFLLVMPSCSVGLAELTDIEVIGNNRTHPELWDAICDGTVTGDCGMKKEKRNIQPA